MGRGQEPSTNGTGVFSNNTCGKDALLTELNPSKSPYKPDLILQTEGNSQTNNNTSDANHSIKTRDQNKIEKCSSESVKQQVSVDKKTEPLLKKTENSLLIEAEIHYPPCVSETTLDTYRPEENKTQSTDGPLGTDCSQVTAQRNELQGNRIDVSKDFEPIPFADESDKEPVNSDISHDSTKIAASEHSDTMATGGAQLPDDVPESSSEIEDKHKAEMVAKLNAIRDIIAELDDVPDLFDNTSLECLKPSTLEALCIRLDIDSDISADSQLMKNYYGMAEYIGLEIAFIKYLKSVTKWKTTEVISKWLTREGIDIEPTIGNLKKCLVGENGIDRPDVLTDIAKKIAKDALAWEDTRYEANTKAPTVQDTSWQLTRHDVVTGKATFYTCCLVYADEDEGMAQVITKMYKTVKQDALFFIPQFDLKRGKYIYDTTARVIEQRCGGKVIFLLSEYFFASHVCQFSVAFAAALAKGAGNGNLIPFHLTNKIDHVPAVLRGIAGIRWFRRPTRHHVWDTITDTLLGGKISEEDMMAVKERIAETIVEDTETYLGNAPYEEGTPSPGKPLEIDEPETDPSLLPPTDILSPETLKYLNRTKWQKIKSSFSRKFSSMKSVFKKSRSLPEESHGSSSIEVSSQPHSAPCISSSETRVSSSDIELPEIACEIDRSHTSPKITGDSVQQANTSIVVSEKQVSSDNANSNVSENNQDAEHSSSSQISAAVTVHTDTNIHETVVVNEHNEKSVCDETKPGTFEGSASNIEIVYTKSNSDVSEDNTLNIETTDSRRELNINDFAEDRSSSDENNETESVRTASNTIKPVEHITFVENISSENAGPSLESNKEQIYPRSSREPTEHEEEHTRVVHANTSTNTHTNQEATNRGRDNDWEFV